MFSSSASAQKITSPAGSRPSARARSSAASIIVTPPFMSIAPRPHTKPSCRSARERRAAPALARGRDHVDMALEQERRRGAAAGQARDQVGALRLAGADRALDAGLGEQALDVGDARALVARRVGGVEPDQVAEQLRGARPDFRAGSGGAHAADVRRLTGGRICRQVLRNPCAAVALPLVFGEALVHVREAAVPALAQRRHLDGAAAQRGGAPARVGGTRLEGALASEVGVELGRRLAGRDRRRSRRRASGTRRPSRRRPRGRRC